MTYNVRFKSGTLRQWHSDSPIVPIEVETVPAVTTPVQETINYEPAAIERSNPIMLKRLELAEVESLVLALERLIQDVKSKGSVPTKYSAAITNVRTMLTTDLDVEDLDAMRLYKLVNRVRARRASKRKALAKLEKAGGVSD